MMVMRVIAACVVALLSYPISADPIHQAQLVVLNDVSNTTTTFSDVTGLTVPLEVGIVYRFACFLTYTTAATTTAIQVSLNGPAASVLDYGVSVATSATAINQSVQTAYDTVVNPGTGGGTTRLPAQITGTVRVSAAGTLAVRFRSEVAASAVTIKRGSWCGIAV